MKDITSANIFPTVLKAFESFGMDLSTICRVATDGAWFMSGTGIGFAGLLKSTLQEQKINGDIIFFHCIMHQQNLCGNSLKFKHVPGIVNFK